MYRLCTSQNLKLLFPSHFIVLSAFIDNDAAINGKAAPAAYTLLTAGFPPKHLTDVTQTIEQAGIANSVVIQKL